MARNLRGVVLLITWMGCAAATAFADSKDDAEFKLTPGERVILDLTNQVRMKENLPLFKPNPVLFRVARAHSANMATQGKMEHVLDGKDPAQRATAAGYRFSHVGENIAWSTAIMLEAIFKGWMESPPHRANIVNGNFREIGIGVMMNEKGEVYYTQVFGTQRPPR